jgi:hypothetical protein
VEQEEEDYNHLGNNYRIYANIRLDLELRFGDKGLHFFLVLIKNLFCLIANGILI